MQKCASIMHMQHSTCAQKANICTTAHHAVMFTGHLYLRPKVLEFARLAIQRLAHSDGCAPSHALRVFCDHSNPDLRRTPTSSRHVYFFLLCAALTIRQNETAPKNKAQSVAERIAGIKACPRFLPNFSDHTYSACHLPAAAQLTTMVSSPLQEQKPSLEQAYACEGAVLEWVQSFFGKV
jgi:hypothetical protein